jgi:nucleoid-associated protein YgaU
MSAQPPSSAGERTGEERALVERRRAPPPRAVEAKPGRADAGKRVAAKTPKTQKAPEVGAPAMLAEGSAAVATKRAASKQRERAAGAGEPGQADKQVQRKAWSELAGSAVAEAAAPGAADRVRRSEKARGRTHFATGRAVEAHARHLASSVRQVRHARRRHVGHAAGGGRGGPTWYVVRRGDTLWGIAARHYGSGWRYQRIYRANARRLDAPDRIHPGQRLYLPRLARRL